MATSKAARSKFAEAQTPASSVLRWYVRLREGSERVRLIPPTDRRRTRRSDPRATTEYPLVLAVLEEARRREHPAIAAARSKSMHQPR